MADTKPKSPEEILSQLLQNGNTVDPFAPVDSAPYMPQYGQTAQQQANDTVNLQYNSQQRALEDAARQASQENQYQRSIEQGYGREVDPRLANVYSALGNTLTQDRAATQENYSGAIDKIRGYYDEASAANQGVNTDLLKRITDSAQELGLGAAVPSATQQLGSDYQFNEGQLASGKAGRSANLATLAAQIFGLDTGRISSAAAEGAQVRSSAQTEVLKTLGDLLRQNQKEQGSYRSQISGLLGDKAIDLRKTLGDITTQRSQDSINAHKSALEEFLGRSGLQQSQQTSQAGLAQFLSSQAEQKREFDAQIAQANADRAAANARAAAKGSGGGSGNPLNDMYKMLQIDALQQKLGQEKYAPGRVGLSQFYKSDQPFWTKSGKGPGKDFKSAVDQILAKTMSTLKNMPSSGIDPNTGYPIPKGPTAKSPYLTALDILNNTKVKSGKKSVPITSVISRRALESALQVFFNGVKAP